MPAVKCDKINNCISNSFLLREFSNVYRNIFKKWGGKAHSLTSYSRVAFYDRPRIMEAIKKTKSQRTRMNLANKVASGILWDSMEQVIDCITE